MFGRKKDEGTEYFGDYYQKNNYGEADTRDTYDSVISVLQPFLTEDENILYSSGDGNCDESILEKWLNLDGTKKGYAIVAAYFASIFVSILIIKHGSSEIGGLILILCAFSPFVVSIVLLIIYCVKPSSVNCAITDKRVISMIGSHWNEIALKEISDTSIRKGRNKTGAILVRSNGHSVESTADYLFIYNVYDPFNVKQLLDEAVKKAKINEYQD